MMWKRLRNVGFAIGWEAVIGWLPLSVYSGFSLLFSHGADFGMYYAAAETLRYSPHADLYSLQTLAATVQAHGGCEPTSAWPDPYPYQPLLAMMLEPFTTIPCRNLAAIWFMINFVLWFGMAGVFTVHTWRWHGRERALLVAMLSLFLIPVLSGISYGQIHLVILAILVVSMSLISRGHSYAGGVVLGFGVVLKYFPAFLVFYYLLRGRWRVAAGAAVATLALVIAQWLVVGPRLLLASISAGERDVRYYAALNDGGYWMNALPGGVYIGYLAFVVFVAVVIWLRWVKRIRTAHELVGGGWALATMLMISPLVWWYYLTWLLPALVICLDVALRYARQAGFGHGWNSYIAQWWPCAALAVSYGLIEVIPLHAPHPVYRAAALGTLLLWLLCGALYVWSAGVRLPWTPLRRTGATETAGVEPVVEAAPG